MSARDDILTLLATASRHAPPCPEIWDTRRTSTDAERELHGDVLTFRRPPTPDEWAAHLMQYARAIGRAVETELANSRDATERRKMALDAAREAAREEAYLKGFAAGRSSVVESLRREHPDAVERHAVADDIEEGRL